MTKKLPPIIFFDVSGKEISRIARESMAKRMVRVARDHDTMDKEKKFNPNIDHAKIGDQRFNFENGVSLVALKCVSCDRIMDITNDPDSRDVGGICAKCDAHLDAAVDAANAAGRAS